MACYASPGPPKPLQVETRTKTSLELSSSSLFSAGKVRPVYRSKKNEQQTLEAGSGHQPVDQALAAGAGPS